MVVKRTPVSCKFWATPSSSVCLLFSTSAGLGCFPLCIKVIADQYGFVLTIINFFKWIIANFKNQPHQHDLFCRLVFHVHFCLLICYCLVQIFQIECISIFSDILPTPFGNIWQIWTKLLSWFFFFSKSYNLNRSLDYVTHFTRTLLWAPNIYTNCKIIEI